MFRFARLPEAIVRHGVTGRDQTMPDEGDFSYVTGTDAARIRGNRLRWAARVGVPLSRLVCARQTHGNRPYLVSEADAGRGSDGVESALPGVDALIVAEPALPVAVLCADCVPVLLVDPLARVAAAVHAGWRGTVADIVGETVRLMERECEVDPSRVLAGLGPSIGPACYEVGPEVIDAWLASGLDPRRAAVCQRGERRYFDLWTANRLALRAAGVRDANIEVSGICTRSNADRYFSRRAGQGHRGLFAAIIALV